MWFSVLSGGIVRFDGTEWTTFTEEDYGLDEDAVMDILEDSQGNLWFAVQAGVARFKDGEWTSFTAADGLSESYATKIIEDRDGNLWFGTSGGLSRFDGAEWRNILPDPECSSCYVWDFIQDSSGELWVAGDPGVIRCEIDRVPPHTVLRSAPQPLSTSRFQTASFKAAFMETEDVEFSYSVDGSPWSAWSPLELWSATGLAAGMHTFSVRARDNLRNVEPDSAAVRFEIDATPPDPILSSPLFGQAVRGSVRVVGTASDSRFREYLLEYRLSDAASWDPPEAHLITRSGSPVDDGTLALWDVAHLPDGTYSLRLSVTDTLGLVGSDLVTVIVDNEAPWADETAPAEVKAAGGGNIYTTNEEVHLYFPPHAFDEDSEVDIVKLNDADVPDTLLNAARLVVAGYEISWGGAVLQKPATLEMVYVVPEMSVMASQRGDIERSPNASDEGESSLVPVTSWTGDIETLISEGHSPPVDGALALYVFGADSTWRRLGGTVDASAKRITCAISEPGWYAIYGEAAGVSGPSTLSDVVVTPRVFSPRGAFASEEAAISFTLGRSGPATVKVYNRAGRLVREVAEGGRMNAGANLVRWDGRDGDAELAPAGLYFITIEALGETKSKTVSIVR
jgi:hypothetical protein